MNPVLTPEIILNQTVEYTPTSRLELAATGRYVGQSHLDNTNKDAFVTPSFLVVDANVALNVWRSTRLVVQVNNVFNRKRVFPSGYSYRFFTPDGTIDGISYFYPQATRNAVVSLRVNL